MAYMSQDKKKMLAPGIKAVLAKYGVKGSISVLHSSKLVVKLKSGDIDFVNSTKEHDSLLNGKTNAFHYQVNPYWLDDHWAGDALKMLEELHAAMSVGNHDRSDIMTDYFDVGWYTDINVGEWDTPYIYTGLKAAA